MTVTRTELVKVCSSAENKTDDESCDDDNRVHKNSITVKAEELAEDERAPPNVHIWRRRAYAI